MLTGRKTGNTVSSLSTLGHGKMAACDATERGPIRDERTGDAVESIASAIGVRLLSCTSGVKSNQIDDDATTQRVFRLHRRDVDSLLQHHQQQQLFFGRGVVWRIDAAILYNFT